MESTLSTRFLSWRSILPALETFHSLASARLALLPTQVIILPTAIFIAASPARCYKYSETGWIKGDVQLFHLWTRYRVSLNQYLYQDSRRDNDRSHAGHCPTDAAKTREFLIKDEMVWQSCVALRRPRMACAIIHDRTTARCRQ